MTIVSNETNDAWRCQCGNDVMSDGFYPSDLAGVEVVPDPHWLGYLHCRRCGRVMDSHSHRPNPEATDEWDSHIVSVVRGPYQED